MGVTLSSMKSNKAKPRLSISGERRNCVEERLDELEKKISNLEGDYDKHSRICSDNMDLVNRLQEVESELHHLRSSQTRPPSSDKHTPPNQYTAFDLPGQLPASCATDNEESVFLLLPDHPEERLSVHSSSTGGSEVARSPVSNSRPRRKHIVHQMTEIEAYGKGLNPHDKHARREYSLRKPEKDKE